MDKATQVLNATVLGRVPAWTAYVLGLTAVALSRSQVPELANWLDTFQTWGEGLLAVSALRGLMMKKQG